MQETYDVAVIGGGPAGLAAALAADRSGAKTVLIEREGRLGGVLKQCIHDGFGVIRFSEKLAGCEYGERFVNELKASTVTVRMPAFVTHAEKTDAGVRLTLSDRSGLKDIEARALVLATGCRERTARQVGIHGQRPAGVLTAGAAQYYINVMGKLPCHRAVILGSGDIGLIMARRLTLEGAEVEGVYEVKSTPSGLMRNVYQCLTDFDIPLYLSHTVTEVRGEGRVTGVTVAAVDEGFSPIHGTERDIECDGLILSVGLIPENELAESLGVELDPRTRGPVADQNAMTRVDGIFACGNSLHVSDLADYVSESGETAGRAAAAYAGKSRVTVPLTAGDGFLYAVPQLIDISVSGETPIYFRAASDRGMTKVSLLLDGVEIFKKNYLGLRPPEMQRIAPLLRGLTAESRLELVMKEG